VKLVNEFATWTAIVSTVIGGGIWIGGIDARASNHGEELKAHKAQIDKLRDEGPPAIARLEEKTDALKDDIGDVKESQAEILKELRKK
jgi:hypothetical protein